MPELVLYGIRELAPAIPRTLSSTSSGELCIKVKKNLPELILFSRDLLNIEDFDAVVFHPRVVHLSDLPVKRKSTQLYIYYNIEGPLITRREYHG